MASALTFFWPHVTRYSLEIWMLDSLETQNIFNRKNKMYLQKYSAETRYTFPIPLTPLQLLNHCLAQNIEYFIPYLNIWSGMYVKVKWHLNKSCGSVSQVGRLRRSHQMVPRICITATVVLWPKMKAPQSTVTAPHTVSATLGKTRTSKRLKSSSRISSDGEVAGCRAFCLCQIETYVDHSLLRSPLIAAEAKRHHLQSTNKCNWTDMIIKCRVSV